MTLNLFSTNRLDYVEWVRSYRSKKRDPVVFYVDGYKIFTAPPPSAGIIVAKAINILEGFRLRRIGRNGMAYHL